MTVGLYCRELLLDQHYFETILPRIPEVISRNIKDGIAAKGFDTKVRYRADTEPRARCGGASGNCMEGASLKSMASLVSRVRNRV